MRTGILDLTKRVLKVNLKKDEGPVSGMLNL